jgi:hypothetical protein
MGTVDSPNIATRDSPRSLLRPSVFAGWIGIYLPDQGAVDDGELQPAV